MSRSIHVTRQSIARARRFRYSDRERRIALLDDLEARHTLKHDMKRAIRQRIGPILSSGAPVTADELAISFDRRNPFARYPAFEDDLRAILQRLPLGVLDGLSSISLSLGTEYQRDQAEEWNEQDRSPKLTVLCRSIERVWFLLHQGQFHSGPATGASAPLSTGVLPVRRTIGQFY
jgi:hypothetical protein